MKAKFAPRVKLVSSDYGVVRVVHAEEAQRLFNAGQAIRSVPGKRIEELLLVDHHPGSDSKGHSSNSLRAGYMESLGGGERISISTQREERQVTTEQCRAYKLKSIADDCWPLYHLALIENLVYVP